MTAPLTLDELERAPLTVDLPTAGRAWGMGRAKSYEAARTGEFPVPVLRVGHRYRVATAAIRAALTGDQQ